MIVYYQEKDGDYLAIDTSTNSYYVRCFLKDHCEGRATAIAGQGWLGLYDGGFQGSSCERTARRSAKATVPAEMEKGHRPGECQCLTIWKSATWPHPP